MNHAWVIGSSGLLGSAVVRALTDKGTQNFLPEEPFNWRQQAVLEGQLARAVQDFSAYMRSKSDWQIYWAAGIGTMGSTDSDLVTETRTLEHLLHLIERSPDLAARPGAIAFASSAGAIYAGSHENIIDESVTVAPTTPYAHAKLAQEHLLETFAERNQQVNILLARMTTIYGSGQATGKQQGLLAHMARSVVRNRPIQIYVPFDTIRDYICVDDAAASMVVNLSAIDSRSRVRTMIIAAEQPTTIAEIVSLFKRLARRAPRIVTSASKLGGLYSRRVQFRSVAVPAVASPRRTSLLVGIAQLLAAERSAFASSSVKRER